MHLLQENIVANARLEVVVLDFKKVESVQLVCEIFQVLTVVLLEKLFQAEDSFNLLLLHLLTLPQLFYGLHEALFDQFLLVVQIVGEVRLLYVRGDLFGNGLPQDPVLCLFDFGTDLVVVYFLLDVSDLRPERLDQLSVRHIGVGNCLDYQLHKLTIRSDRTKF